jgi:hypothetical protein
MAAARQTARQFCAGTQNAPYSGARIFLPAEIEYITNSESKNQMLYLEAVCDIDNNSKDILVTTFKTIETCCHLDLA